MVGGNSLQQLLVIGGGAGRRDLADARGEILADAGQRQQLGVARGRATAFGAVGDHLGAGAIGADPERVLALQLEQIGDLVQDAGDGEVLHVPHDKTARSIL